MHQSYSYHVYHQRRGMYTHMPDTFIKIFYSLRLSYDRVGAKTCYTLNSVPNSLNILKSVMLWGGEYLVNLVEWKKKWAMKHATLNWQLLIILLTIYWTCKSVNKFVSAYTAEWRACVVCYLFCKYYLLLILFNVSCKLKYNNSTIQSYPWTFSKMIYW